MAKSIILVAFGGALGSVLRYIIHILSIKFFPSKTFMATLLVNIVGCFLIGYFTGILDKKITQNIYITNFLIIGFCGGFTTYSSFALQQFQFINSNQLLTFATYSIVTFIFAIICVYLGFYLSKF